MTNKTSYEQWKNKTIKINKSFENTLKIGDRVQDSSKNGGIVVKIIEGHNNEDHGTIYVWQENQKEYGADNCEHYPQFGWEDILRIVKRH